MHFTLRLVTEYAVSEQHNAFALLHSCDVSLGQSCLSRLSRNYIRVFCISSIMYIMLLSSRLYDHAVLEVPAVQMLHQVSRTCMGIYAVHILVNFTNEIAM